MKHTALAGLLLAKGALTLFLVGSPLSNAASAAENHLQTVFEVNANGKTLPLSLGQLGVKEESLLQSALFSHSLFGSIAFFDKAERQIALNTDDYTWNSAKSESILRRLFDIERPENASFTLIDGQLTLNPETEGYTFDTDEFLQEIIQDGPRFQEYSLEISAADTVTQEELSPLLPQYETLLKYGYTVIVGEKRLSFPTQTRDLSVSETNGKTVLSLSESYEDELLSFVENSVNVQAENMVIKTKESTDFSRPSHVILEGHKKDGLELDREATHSTLEQAMENGHTEITATVHTAAGEIINETGQDLGPLDLLGTGISNFKGSGAGRIFNVRKALREHVNAILVPPGATVSFNSFLGSVTYGAGWEGAYAIFGGGELRTVPGGGICQSSTTVYRALLSAGLPITAQKSHSLYVHYYAQPSTLTGLGVEGDGLDATIFPGSQDLKFINDTPNYILVEAYDQDFDAVVKIYGQADGRSTELFGPFTRSNQTEEVIAVTGGLSARQIVWKHILRRADGTEEVNWRKSSYKDLVKQY